MSLFNPIESEVGNNREVINLVNTYMWLGIIFFACVIVSIILVAIFDKKIYLLGVLFIIHSIIFFIKWQ
ncbi:hypothetical protein QSV37_09110 [Acinetobacter sp. VNK23]|uniref:hypothetical protein n=1 Tax=Acinetobacter thutiue TaxID=2998078 RepID=UPI0025765B2C|nr:hypothetical protein [Acinetobacter thutiue]MDM1020458.1 hypothetical protein [Acinetobacter thutiue]